MRLRDRSSWWWIALGSTAGLGSVEYEVGGEILSPLVLATAAGAFLPGLFLGILVAFLVNRVRFSADAKKLLVSIERFLRGTSGVVTAVLIAIGGLLSVHTYAGGAGIIWNIINDRIFLTSQCGAGLRILALPGLTSPDNYPYDWVPDNSMDCVVSVPYSAILFLSIGLLCAHILLRQSRWPRLSPE